MRLIFRISTCSPASNSCLRLAGISMCSLLGENFETLKMKGCLDCLVLTILSTSVDVLVYKHFDSEDHKRD